MTKTQNYNLNQWAASDPVRRADFNADNAAIDTAIKAAEQNAASALAAYKSTNDAAVTAARQEAANALAAYKSTNDAAVGALQTEMPKIVAGSYTGDGAATRVISLGFTPAAVFVCTQYGEIYNDFSGGIRRHYGGLALPGAPAQSSSGAAAVTIVSNGFQVAYDTSVSQYHALTNVSGTNYHYLAVR